MLDLGRLKKDSFDGAFCIGNSLVHLQTAKDIQKSLNEIYALLKIGGQLAIQIVNYDRVLKRDVKDLPLINRPEVQVKFIRKYDLIDGMIHFKTRLIVGDDNKTYDNVITLYPLRSTEFKALLETSGFKNIQFYGGFDGKDFDLDAFPMIVTAQK
jgi:SAM-dependent methyltransferase